MNERIIALKYDKITQIGGFATLFATQNKRGLDKLNTYLNLISEAAAIRLGCFCLLGMKFLFSQEETWEIAGSPLCPCNLLSIEMRSRMSIMKPKKLLRAGFCYGG